MLRKAIVFLSFWAAVALPALASSVLPLGLGQIIADAAVAFQGTCTGNQSERDPLSGLIVTYTTFKVSDVLKGSVPVTHTIKQIGGQVNGQGYRVHGVPVFIPGQEYLVFLHGASRSGFSSPVGLSQGQFAIRRGAGAAEVSNGRDFRDLLAQLPAASLQGTSAAAERGQPAELKQLNLDEFKLIVRRHIGGGVK